MCACCWRKNRAQQGQQIATLLGATCCTRLATLLRCVAKCWELKIELVGMLRRNIVARTRPNDYNIMQHPQMLHEKFDHFQHVATPRNRVAKRTQHVAPNIVAICCVELLRSFGRGFIFIRGPISPLKWLTVVENYFHFSCCVLSMVCAGFRKKTNRNEIKVSFALQKTWLPLKQITT